METFEIHITGTEEIIKRANELQIKSIIIDLLKPDRSVLRSEFMTSHVKKFNDYAECYNYTMDLASRLGNVIRVKIESPYYNKYLNQCLYLESHFISDKMVHPTSKNRIKDKLLATARTYAKDTFGEFINNYDEIEMCLFDDFVSEDSDWFVLYD